MFIFFALLFATSSFAADCVPEINVFKTEITAKEGHHKQVSLIDFGVEMDRLCPGESVTLKVLVISETAVVGEHVQSFEVNSITIPAGSAVGMMSIGIIGDDEWNEPRTFRVRAINPSHGWVNMAETLVTIKNDDPLISFVAPTSVREPKQGKKQIPLRVELDMPADQRISGEVLIKGITTDEEDILGTTHIGFELLPGDTYFEFLPNSLSVLADDKREISEQLSFELIALKGATPSPARTFMNILDPANSLELSFKSVIKAMMEGGQVGMTSTYSHKLILESSEDDETLFVANATKPTYTHIVPAMPFPIVTTPGLLAAKIIKDGETLTKVRIEFVEAPTERYAMIPYAQYLFMASFGKLHYSEMVTSPEKALYAVFDLEAVRPSATGVWSGVYKQNITEDGVEVLREISEISIKEIND